MPVSVTAFLSLSVKIPIIVYWIEAQISLRFSSIKSGLSLTCFWTKYKTAVLKPEKLKFKPSTLGLVNLNASGLPNLASLSICGPAG